MHASAVAFHSHHGALIVGPSGSGKSQLALALIERGAQLVSDDQVLLCSVNNALFARAPRPIAGLIEARGLGLLRVPHRRLVQISLIVDLGVASAPRFPEPETRTLQGVTLPVLPGRTDPAFASVLAQTLLHSRTRVFDV